MEKELTKEENEIIEEIRGRINKYYELYIAAREKARKWRKKLTELKHPKEKHYYAAALAGQAEDKAYAEQMRAHEELNKYLKEIGYYSSKKDKG